MVQFFPAVSSTTSALNAERSRLEVIAQNIANANTTRGLNGKPYARQQVVFESVLQQAQAGNAVGVTAPRVASIRTDNTLGRQVYQPGHPDADEKGMVRMPNVNLFEEMADMVVASRSFEANLAVMKNGRSLAMQALNIGKR